MNSGTTLPAIVGPNGSALATMQQSQGINAVRETMETLKAIRTFVKNEMVDGLDFGLIPGTGQKPALLQPGAQKTALYFNATPDHHVEKTELGNGHVEFLITTRLVSRTTGSVIGMGLGSCSTMEKKYRYRNSSRRCPACGAEAIIAGNPDWNGGVRHFLCHKKRGGCGAKFAEDNVDITRQVAGQVDNPDVYDARNTVLKMAVKRSFVAAALSLGCLSELFTQDIEETYDIAPGGQDGAHDRDHDTGRQSVNEAFPARGGSERRSDGNDDAPRSGKALFAWVKEQEQRHAVGLLKWLNGWAKLQEYPGRMVDWDSEEVATAYGEALRKLQAIQTPPEGKTPPRDELDDPMPQKAAEAPSWASYVAKVCNERRTHWHNELAIANVPVADRTRPENLLPDQHQVVNHFVSHAIERGTIKPEDVSKDGTADGPRDPSKAKAAMADLFRRAPKRIAAAVDSYFAEKERALRVRLGMDDLEDATDTAGQDAAEGASQEQPAGREPGSDDDR